MERFSIPETQALIPPTESIGSLSKSTIRELQERYPKRYELYVKWLRGRDAMSEVDRADMRRWLHAMNALDEYIFLSHEDADATLRTHQKDVFDAIRAHVESGKRTGYVRLPTGVGKTVIFIEVAEALNGKTLVVTSRKNLVSQIADSFSQFAEGLDVGVRYSIHKDIGKQVTVTTYDSLIRGVKDGSIDPASFDLVVLDEAHRGLSRARQESIASFHDAFVFGFSATPTFTETKSLAQLFGEAIYEMHIREAIESGQLCGVSVMLAQTDVDVSNVSVDTAGNYTEEALEKALNTATLTHACVELYKRQFSQESGIVFCAGVEHAKSIANAFRAENISAEAIWGDMPEGERSRILSAFKEGTVRLLANVDVLTEGFDAERASVCFNVAPTGSLVRAEQRAGRVLRLSKAQPGKMATVVDFLHKDERSPYGSRQVFFSEIVKGAALVPSTTAVSTVSVDGIPPTETTRASVGDIPGLRIIVDAEEVMRITHDTIALRGQEQRQEKLPWDAFVAAVRQAAKDAHVSGSVSWYKQTQEQHTDWPNNPYKFYSEWTSWPELFRREKKLPWDAFVMSVRQAAQDTDVPGSVSWYKQMGARHPRWPANPDKVYCEWTSWSELFGRKRRNTVEKMSWSDFVTSVQELAQNDGAIQNGARWYRNVRKQHPEWPASPEGFYDEWISWMHLVGREKDI